MFDRGETASSRVHWATERLRQEIISGALAPGQKLRAERLAAEWHVSATPVREAFQRLVAEGLVTYTAQRGVRVAEATLQELQELYELRERLEPWALERSIPRLDQEGKASIEQHLERLEPWRRRPSLTLTSAEYEAVHQAFHSSLIAACGSLRLLELVATLSRAATRYRNLVNATGDPETAWVEHTRLAELAMRGAVPEAVAAQQRHLRGTTNRVIVLLEAADAAN